MPCIHLIEFAKLHRVFPDVGKYWVPHHSVENKNGVWKINSEWKYLLCVTKVLCCPPASPPRSPNPHFKPISRTSFGGRKWNKIYVRNNSVLYAFVKQDCQNSHILLKSHSYIWLNALKAWTLDYINCNLKEVFLSLRKNCKKLGKWLIMNKITCHYSLLNCKYEPTFGVNSGFYLYYSVYHSAWYHGAWC